MSLAQEIKQLRAAAGLTQKQLAEKIGVSQPFVADLESGKRAGVSVDTLYKLSDALGVPVDHWRVFLADADAEPAAKPKTRKPKK